MTNTRKRFRTLSAFVAGLHTGNGLAHGVRPSTGSPVFRRNRRAPGVTR